MIVVFSLIAMSKKRERNTKCKTNLWIEFVENKQFFFVIFHFHFEKPQKYYFY